MHIGNHDIPVDNMLSDRLSMDAQVEGLAQFVQECETPLTISIQGSWGTGKTSFVNLVMDVIFSGNKIENSEDIVFVPFNSWQFVQFDMSEQLSSNLILAITKELGKRVKNEEDRKSVLDIVNGMEILKATGRLGVLAANNYFKEKLNVDVKQTLDDVGFSDTEKILKQTKEIATAIDTISSLKKKLQKTIDASLGITEEMRRNATSRETAEKLRKKRVIIFVDDLDRLPPDKAIEVLEILKMFLDCEHCVFLLAIDYNVVLNGVTIKYRNSITEEKGRDFFEKMIQVVYTLPNTMSHTDRYIAEILDKNGHNISLAYDFAELVKKGDKDNPRAIKRLLNSYFLLDMMKKNYYKEKQGQSESVVQFAVLCLQNICPDVYDYFSEQFASNYNYEKGIQWFNAFHKYCYEMSKHSTSTINIRGEKLEQWNLIKSDKKIDKIKIEFLCTLFDKLDGNTLVKQEPGKQLNIQDIIRFKSAVQWTNLVQGRVDGHTYLDNIAKIEIVYGGYKIIPIETCLGNIEEAYELTITKILEFLKKDGIYDDSNLDTAFPTDETLVELVAEKKKKSIPITPEEEFENTIDLFGAILSLKEKNSLQWKCINVLGTKVWLKTYFEEIEQNERFDAIISIVQILSKYSKVGFSWYKDRRGKEILACGYDSQEGCVFIQEVSFITVNGVTTRIPKHNVEKAYVETVRQILENLEEDKFDDCIKHFSSIVKYGFEMETNSTSGDEFTSIDFNHSGFEHSDFEDSVDIWDADDIGYSDNVGEEITDEVFNVAHVESVSIQNNKAYGDDLDEITPVEYEDEYDRRLREVVAIENEDGWFEGDEAVDGWRYEALINDGAQVDINIYVGEHNSVALMAMNAYRISKYTGVDFVWYEDAYMKKVVNKGCTEENEILNKLKNNILSRVCRKAPELFRAPELYFLEDPLGFTKYRLEE